MKDLIIVTADGTMKRVFQAFFKRDEFHLSLGCGRIAIDAESDILNISSLTDGGLYSRAQEELRRYLPTHKHAIVVLDQQFGAELPADEVQNEIETNLHRNGWNGVENSACVIVIDPEIEVWLWQDASPVQEALRYRSAGLSLREDLRQNGNWPDNSDKPMQPKELFKELIRRYHAGTASVVYCDIAEKVSVRRCKDPSFLRFQNQLRTWFPPESA